MILSMQDSTLLKTQQKGTFALILASVSANLASQIKTPIRLHGELAEVEAQISSLDSAVPAVTS